MLAGCYVVGLGLGFANGLFFALWSLWLADIGASLWLIGLTYTGFALPSLLLTPFAGRLGDRIGRLSLLAWPGAAEAAIYLPWVTATALSGVLAFQMDGVFIGATWSRDMRNMMLLSFLIFCAALLTLGPAFGNHGLWVALNIFLLARGLSLLAELMETRQPDLGQHQTQRVRHLLRQCPRLLTLHQCPMGIPAQPQHQGP